MDQPVDQAGALILASVLQKGAVFFDAGQCAGEVQGGAAQKGLVIAQFGGQQAELLQTVVDDGIELGLRRRIGPPVVFVCRQHDHFGADGEAVEAGEDEGIASCAGGHEAVFIDLRGAGIVHAEQREIGHVAYGAVRIARRDLGLLRADFAIEDHAIRGQRDFDWQGHGFVVVGCAGLNPAQQRLVVDGVLGEQASTGVRHFALGLQENQTLFGNGHVDPASHIFLGEAEVISLGIVAEKRQHETILPARGAMA